MENELTILSPKRHSKNPRRRKDDFLVDIYRSAIKFLYPLELSKVYRVIVREAMALSGAVTGSIFLYNGEGLVRVYSTIPKSRQINPRKHGIVYRVFRTKKPLVIPARQFRIMHPESGRFPPKIRLLIPLLNNDRVFGVLSMAFPKNFDCNENVVGTLSLFCSVATLAISKVRLLSELQKAVETRDLFISITSHELKIPITTIKGYSQLINDKISRGEIPPIQWSQQLLIEIERMSKLVNEFLQLNQIRTGKLKFDFKDFSFRDMLSQAVADVRLIHPDYQIVVRESNKTTSDVISGDRDKLLQVILNLLNNAIKYSPFGSKVTISVDYDKEKLSLGIADQGTGIKKADMAHIFEEFYRGSEGKREGLGLGLFLTKKIIDGHKGRISVKSKAGKGTLVSIIVPTGQN